MLDLASQALLLGSVLAMLAQTGAALPAGTDMLGELVRRSSKKAKKVKGKGKGLSTGAIVAIVVVIVVVVILAISAYFLWRHLKKRKANKAAAQMNHDSSFSQPLTAAPAQMNQTSLQPPPPPPQQQQQGAAASYYN